MVAETIDIQRLVHLSGSWAWKTLTAGGWNNLYCCPLRISLVLNSFGMVSSAWQFQGTHVSLHGSSKFKDTR